MRVIRFFLWLFVLLFLVAILGDTVVVLPLQLCGAVLFGWIPAAGRLLKGASGHAQGLAVWVSAFLFFLMLAASFGKWVATQRKAPWRFKWAASAVAAVWLVLFAAMAVIGVAHQIGWILAAGEPLLVERGAHRLMSVASRMSFVAREHDLSPVAVRKAAAEFADRASVIPISNTNGQVTTILVVGRAREADFVEYHLAGGFRKRPMSELSEALPPTKRR